MLLAEVAPEGAELAPPSRDREEMAAGPKQREFAEPAIVDQEAHRRARPLALVGGAPAQFGREHVVTIAEDVGLDRDEVADHALDREAAIVDRRCHGLDGQSVTIQA